MDPDEIEPASSGESLGLNLPCTTSGDLSAPRPGGRAPTSRVRGPGRVPNAVTAIAAAIINSSMITHSVVITVIVTISVLTAAFALEWAGAPHADR